jgi:MFS family permease
VLPIAAVVGGGVGLLIRRDQARRDGMSEPITDNPHEAGSSRMVGLFGVLCGIVCGIVGSVLGGYVAPYIEQREFPEIWAQLKLPLVMTLAGMLVGGCFGWLFGWLLAALLRHKHLRTRGDHILIWVFGLFPISVVTTVIVVSGYSFKPNGYLREGPFVTIDLVNFLFEHAAWLIIALVAYPLSSGPAYSFAIKHIAFFRPVELVYAPLFWITGHCSPLRNAQHRYMEFWAVRR